MTELARSGTVKLGEKGLENSGHSLLRNEEGYFGPGPDSKSHCDKLVKSE